MERLFDIRKHNKGVTLMELIVAIALLSIVSITMISFLTLGVNQYRRQTEDVAMQRQAQMLQTQLRDVLSDANRTIYVASDPDKATDLELLNKFTLNGKRADSVLVVMNSDMKYIQGYDIEKEGYYVYGSFITYFRDANGTTGSVYYNELNSADIKVLVDNKVTEKTYQNNFEEEIMDVLIQDAQAYDASLFSCDCADWPKLAEYVKELKYKLVRDPNNSREIDRVDSTIKIQVGNREQSIEHSVALRNVVYDFTVPVSNLAEQTPD